MAGLHANCSWWKKKWCWLQATVPLESLNVLFPNYFQNQVFQTWLYHVSFSISFSESYSQRIAVLQAAARMLLPQFKSANLGLQYWLARIKPKFLLWTILRTHSSHPDQLRPKRDLQMILHNPHRKKGLLCALEVLPSFHLQALVEQEHHKIKRFAECTKWNVLDNN